MIAAIQPHQRRWIGLLGVTLLTGGLLGPSAPLVQQTDDPATSAPVPTIPRKDFQAAPGRVVVKVVTGDTLIVRTGDESRRIALLGVTAPALSQPFGPDARLFLENLLAGETVYVEYPPGTDELDRFGRYPAFVYRAPEGLWINLEIVRQGFARVDPSPPFEHTALFEHFEKLAREQRKGAWATSAGATASSQPAPDTAAPRVSSQPTAGGDDIVYVTASGKKYHRATCQHAKRATAIVLADAKARGYEPCSRCKPPK